MYGNVTVTPWLILKMITSPKSLKTALQMLQQCYCTIQMGFIMIQLMENYKMGYLCTFAGSNGNFNPTSGILVDGQARSLFTAKVEGKTNIKTTIDNQTVSISVNAYSYQLVKIAQIQNRTAILTQTILTAQIILRKPKQYQCSILVYLSHD